MTPSCQISSNILLQPSLNFTESIDYKKNFFDFFFIIIFGGDRSPGGVRFLIRSVWSLALPVIFEIPQ